MESEVILLILLLQTATPDWELRMTFASSSPYSPPFAPGFGNSVCTVEDVNDDGVTDFVIAAAGTEINGIWRTGIVEIRSGATLNLLYTLTGEPGVAFGYVVESVGDLDGDGAGDFLVSEGTRFPNRVHAISGRTGTILYSVHEGHLNNGFGENLTRLGDLDFDGTEDFAVSTAHEGVVGADISGAVWAFSGATGARMFWKTGFLSSQQFGMRMRGGRGDLDGDGVPDFLVMDIARGFAGRVQAFSGATQKALYEVNGLAYDDFMGVGMDFVPDVDGDGCDDFILGSVPDYPAGFVTLFSGKSGSRMWTRFGTESYDRFGEYIHTIPDITGDGYAEILVAATQAGNGTGLTFLLSSVTGDVVSIFEGPPSSGIGTALADLPAQGGGDPSLLLGAQGAETIGPPDGGEVYLFEARPYLQPSTLELSAIAGGTLSLAVDFPDTEAGKAYQVLASTGARGGFRRGGLEIPLVPNAFFHSFLHDTPAAFAGASGTLDAAGDASATLTLAPGALAAWVGRTLKVAAVSLDANRQPSVVSWARAIHILP